MILSRAEAAVTGMLHVMAIKSEGKWMKNEWPPFVAAASKGRIKGNKVITGLEKKTDPGAPLEAITSHHHNQVQGRLRRP